MDEKSEGLAREAFYELIQKPGSEVQRTAKFVALLGGLLVEKGLVSEDEFRNLVEEVLR